MRRLLPVRLLPLRFDVASTNLEGRRCTHEHSSIGLFSPSYGHCSGVSESPRLTAMQSEADDSCFVSFFLIE
ncbi:hypothetical protein PFISCL1PPCAC_12407 [Pristionchus fissidentatus]|uniref:Secreted protein n=1 Tax=Pristionchus fissidentatus TaxID=1538716 RepID=A0AAV5VNI6_9BILA|nr:hypothetical protein PFISCL1PPCAC_12400 [Pristionchus fissidentatus]GMT21110.1 hypothetical protein PFISCL1PPCAC_12407 [Pristionchus fissidentatus]